MDPLASEILSLIEAGPGGDPDRFEGLALAVFAHQLEQNAPFREFCRTRGASPERITSWRAIPAFPSDAFKREVVASFPAERAVMAQLTSGSSQANARGRIYRDEQGRALVLAANRVMTGAWLFPDFAAERRCRLLLLTPSSALAPSMGMAIGMEETRRRFGTADSAFLVGRSGLDVATLTRALGEAEDTGVPLALVGATSAFVVYLTACRERGWSFRLPAGSRLADGGGYRGRFGELTRDGYYQLVEEVLGVPADHCVNVLGMAESATNYFDSVLRERLLGAAATQARSVSGEASQPPTRRKVPPPWTRVLAVSARDLSPLPPGETGLLRHYDLANLPTVLGVQSDNLGRTFADGSFEIDGRAQVVDGEVSLLPSERPVGPMGDRRIFRLLDDYLRFSIRFKMRGVSRPKPR